MTRRTAIQDLRNTIDRLPLVTREAMLEGVRNERIIVGAYTDGTGGVCPMLAAHRRGGRTSLLQFAQTWDAFTRAPARGSRPAKERELRILARHLEASIRASAAQPPESDLALAIAEHRNLVQRRAPTAPVAAPEQPRLRRERRPAPVRMPAWMQPLGSIEEYERALEEVDRQKVRLGLVGDTAGPARPGVTPERPLGTAVAR